MFPRVLYLLIPLFVTGVIGAMLSLIDIALMILGGPGYIERLTKVDADTFAIGCALLVGFTFVLIVIAVVRRKRNNQITQHSHDEDR